jgi:integrase
MARHLLTDRKVTQAKIQAKPYRLADGENLYCFIAASGVKSWQFRYRFDGTPKTLSIGRYPTITLHAAREKAEDARRHLANHRDPIVQAQVVKARTVAESRDTFKTVAESWVKRTAKRKAWTESYKGEVEASIANHLAPLMGLPINVIDARIVAPVLEKVEDSAPYMVEKVRPRLHAILDHAVRQGLIKGNPLPSTEDETRLVRRHFPAITKLPELGEILRKARAADPCKGVQRAHVLLVYTAQRVSEVIGATWDEFDLDAGLWSIPRERMKAHKNPERGAHDIPLPPALLADLRAWRAADGPDAIYVCPAPRDESRSIVPEACEKFYRRTLDLAGKHSPHSWRSAFSTICRDHGKDGDVVEAQLDHVVGSKVQQAYDRAKRLELRRELLAWYESQLIAARDGAKVVKLRAS